MNIIGNKGALWLKFNLYNRSFNFFNCHLMAGTGKGSQRCDMMGTALKGISCAEPSEKFEPDAVADYNFTMGDMNMRYKNTFTEFISAVETANEPKIIKQYDELYEARYSKFRFPNYHEEPITFMPTYKLD